MIYSEMCALYTCNDLFLLHFVLFLFIIIFIYFCFFMFFNEIRTLLLTEKKLVCNLVCSTIKKADSKHSRLLLNHFQCWRYRNGSKGPVYVIFYTLDDNEWLIKGISLLIIVGLIYTFTHLHNTHNNLSVTCSRAQPIASYKTKYHAFIHKRSIIFNM